MSVPTTPSPTAPFAPPTGATAPAHSNPLPDIDTALDSAEVVRRLDESSRRGRMPGFHRGSGPVLFTVTDFGSPFESVLEARSGSSSHGTRLTFSVRMKPRMAWIYGIVLVATVWPGVWITDSMLKTYFPGVNLYTWWWYLLLTVPFVPLGMWSALRKSRESGLSEAREIVERIRSNLAPR